MNWLSVESRKALRKTCLVLAEATVTCSLACVSAWRDMPHLTATVLLGVVGTVVGRRAKLSAVQARFPFLDTVFVLRPRLMFVNVSLHPLISPPPPPPPPPPLLSPYTVTPNVSHPSQF
jgi:hypothetical protein